MGKKCVPILVESTTAILTDVFGPNCPQGSETLGCRNITNDTNNDHWWSLQDGNSFNNFLLVNLCKK